MAYIVRLCIVLSIFYTDKVMMHVERLFRNLGSRCKAIHRIVIKKTVTAGILALQVIKSNFNVERFRKSLSGGWPRY